MIQEAQPVSQSQPDPRPPVQSQSDRKFLIGLIVVSVLLAALPFLVGLFSAPAGTSYLGYQFGTDDQMVYSAWMRQAMDGHFLFDNRFTTDPQPSLTIHIYFFVLGLVAKVVGLSGAAALARLVFGGLFIMLAARLVKRLNWESITTKLALYFTVFGGGIGFLVWHTFGVAIVKPAPPILSDLLGGRLPTDVWQPEGFVFPSMLVNGLFMVSLCLIVLTMLCILDAKQSWKPVLPGALAIGALMNIHSYDVLLVALVMIGFLATVVIRKELTGIWLARTAVIVCGVIPPALWFVHVLKSDTVFQARAQTDTPSANFKAVLFGYILLIALALFGLAKRPVSDPALKNRRLGGIGLAVLMLIGLYVAAGSSTSQYMLDTAGWVLTFLVSLAATAMLADENPVMNLLISWALVGTAAIYFPGLFQRKLTEGLSIPWAILAAYGLSAMLQSAMLQKQEKSIRMLVTALGCILLGATSIRWLGRELQFISANASNTTMQPVFLDADSVKIMSYLNGLSGRHVLIAPPGIPSQAFSQKTQEEGANLTPIVPDLNPIASGLAGVYTYAGHWSETPDYPHKRSLLSNLYYGKMSSEDRAAAMKKIGADYVIALDPKTLPIEGMFDFRSLGDVVVEGTRFRLIHVR